MKKKVSRWLYLCLWFSLLGCDDHSEGVGAFRDQEAVYALANTCVNIAFEEDSRFLDAFSDQSFGVSTTQASAASAFLLRPSDLGHYLLFDDQAGYVVTEGASLARRMYLEPDSYAADGQSGIKSRLPSAGEWQFVALTRERFRLHNLRSGFYLSHNGKLDVLERAASLRLTPSEKCAEFPELSVDASGTVSVTSFEDGDLFGFAETHAHLFGNLGFGGGGVFHGAPFHPLGVEHALPNCEVSHGVKGRKDFMGFFARGVDDIDDVVSVIGLGQLPEDDHDTRGYPDFTSWPDAPRRETHQSLYYRWLERAYLAGMRLLVQHATTNQVLCQLVTKLGSPQRYSCNDMTAVDHSIEAAYQLERYIDAQHGGPGKGWFRIVLDPAQAREVVKAGKLAVVLGIETSDLFNCYLVPYAPYKPCNEQDVLERLDNYHQRGVRALFPNHKYDNAFSPGDGERFISDAGNFAHTGHYSNLIPCSENLLQVPAGFDTGSVAFADLNVPRDDYHAPPPIDMSGFEADPIGTLAPYFPLLGSGEVPGEYCQKHGLTALGNKLFLAMMQRGMIIEVDHLPRRSYVEAFKLLAEHDYPAVGSHGRNNNGLIYQLGGVSMSDFSECRSLSGTASMDDPFQERFELMRQLGTYVSEGFGFDMNGFHPAPPARSGEKSPCPQPQAPSGISYPFASYAGDVLLEQPHIANRTVNYDTEGMVHIGMVAELIEDVRRDGVSDRALEPLFRSAEGYIRMWEKAERWSR